MAVTVTVQPELLKWARQRAGLDPVSLARYLKLKDPSRLHAWEQTGEIRLTELEKIASKAYVPLGYMFLSKPPDESSPIQDFRRTSSHERGVISPNLLDSIRHCQFRQDWYERKMVESSSNQLEFVNSVTADTCPTEIASYIRRMLKIDEQTFRSLSSWEEALRAFVNKIEQAGILVMRSGIVGNNTRRKLDVGEFRGFVLNSNYCPLIFVNLNDAKSAQMFTLAHELAHVWLGHSGISSISFDQDNKIETLCNNIASEVLVPTNVFRNDWTPERDILIEVRRLARIYKVSSLVILIKALQNNFIQFDIFNSLYDHEITRNFQDKKESSGGDFYLTQGVRLSKRFINTVVLETFEGKTTYVEAFQLLGIKSSSTFRKMADFVLMS